MKVKARELFSNRMTTTLTMIGVAVGLGNVWRFPYMMGQYGGSAFLVVYIAFVLIFAIPAVTGSQNFRLKWYERLVGGLDYANLGGRRTRQLVAFALDEIRKRKIRI